MKKFAITVLSLSLVTAVSSLTACTKKDDNKKTTNASVVASTVVTAAPASQPTATPAASSPAVVASTVVVNAASSATPAPAVVTPDAAAASATTKDVTTTTTTTTQTTAAGAHTPLQTDLITLLATGQNLQKEAEVKQDAMEKHLKAKAATAKTPEQQAALQKEMLTDVIAFKTNEKQKLSSVKLTEPRVKAVRDKMVEGLSSEIKASQIVLNNPNPTAQNKKEYDANMKNAQESTMQVRTQLDKLTKEAGMVKDASAAK